MVGGVLDETLETAFCGAAGVGGSGGATGTPLVAVTEGVSKVTVFSGVFCSGGVRGVSLTRFAPFTIFSFVGTIDSILVPFSYTNIVFRVISPKTMPASSRVLSSSFSLRIYINAIF